MVVHLVADLAHALVVVVLLVVEAEHFLLDLVRIELLHVAEGFDLGLDVAQLLARELVEVLLLAFVQHLDFDVEGLAELLVELLEHLGEANIEVDVRELNAS